MNKDDEAKGVADFLAHMDKVAPQAKLDIARIKGERKKPSPNTIKNLLGNSTSIKDDNPMAREERIRNMNLSNPNDGEDGGDFLRRIGVDEKDIAEFLIELNTLLTEKYMVKFKCNPHVPCIILAAHTEVLKETLTKVAPIMDMVNELKKVVEKKLNKEQEDKKD